MCLLEPSCRWDPTEGDFCYTAKTFNELSELISNFSKNKKNFVSKHSENRKKIKDKVFVENNIEKLIKLIAN